jgi:RNA polymerase sigma-70 factor (ECF subfamily)
MKDGAKPVDTRVREVDRGAEIASLHHAALFRWARALARWDEEEAMEIVQQTYIEVIEGRADLLSARDPAAFLFGVARRVAASRRRRRTVWSRILRLELGRSPDTGSVPDPETEAGRHRQEARVRRAVTALQGRQREVVELAFLHEMTIEQAAGVLGVSVGSARTHYHRAKSKLARLLEPAIGDEGNAR